MLVSKQPLVESCAYLLPRRSTAGYMRGCAPLNLRAALARAWECGRRMLPRTTTCQTCVEASFGGVGTSS